MKTYNVVIEHKGQNVSVFKIEAHSLKAALKLANFHKRMDRFKGRIIVTYNRPARISEGVQLKNFEFTPASYGRYFVTYKSPKTGREWVRTVEDMGLIDKTRNADEPKKADLQRLKKFVKG